MVNVLPSLNLLKVLIWPINEYHLQLIAGIDLWSGTETDRGLISSNWSLDRASFWKKRLLSLVLKFLQLQQTLEF